MSLDEKLSNLPKNPGVYIYKDKFNSIIYIGKAKNLKNRVSSYFRNKHENSPKTQVLVKNIHEIEHIIVDNEIEALLLENKLIKKHKPKYNIDLKDSKTFAYIKITEEKIPKITFTRKITKTGSYFGPYTNSEIRRELFFLTVKLFGIITKHTFSNKSTLNYQIGLSPAKSLDEIELNSYYQNIENAKQFLLGKNTKEIISKLKFEMQTASKNEEYELALEKKKYIELIEKSFEKQKVDLIKKHDQDIIAKIENKVKNKSIIIIINISKGTISSKKNYSFDTSETILEEFIKMYYSQNTIPKEIIINQNIEDIEEIVKYLSKISGNKVEIIIPKKGEKYELVKLAEKNAIQLIKNDPLEELKINLNLEKEPKIIECFDMSNFGKTDLVGAMTRWIDLKPDKSGYRKFEIKNITGKNDDYSSIKEVITRRYSKLKNEKLELPDLIIIDGGKGHLNVALNALTKINMQEIPIISIAKGKNRDKNEIYLVNKEEPLIFDNNSQMILNLRKIRDSVHNFVISYNRTKRKLK